MERRQLPDGRSVSAIGLGTWVAGGSGWGGSDARLIVRAVEKAFELGIDLVDTAPVYGLGRSEEIVGDALRELGLARQAFVATKCGLAWDEQGRIRRDSRPAQVRADVEASLGRLGLERLDLVQVHWPDPQVPIEETAAELERLAGEGKIAAWGVSNFDAALLRRAAEAGRPIVDQLPYNLLERDIEKDTLPACRSAGVGVLAYGAVCRGLLTGKVRPETEWPKGDLRRVDPKLRLPKRLEYLRAVDRLRPIAYARQKTMAQLAVRWLLDQPGVTAALWGARMPSQIAEAAGATGWSLSPGELEGIDRILAEEIHGSIDASFMAPPG